MLRATVKVALSRRQLSLALHLDFNALFNSFHYGGDELGLSVWIGLTCTMCWRGAQFESLRQTDCIKFYRGLNFSRRMSG
jgi:hypothetical protein